MNAMKAVRFVAAVALSAVALWTAALWASPSPVPVPVPEKPKWKAVTGMVSVITYPDGRLYVGEIGTYSSTELIGTELRVTGQHIVPHGRGIEMWPNGARAGHWSNGTFMTGSCYGTKPSLVGPGSSEHVSQAKWSLCGKSAP